MMLLKDYLRDQIKEAGFSHAEISKTPTGTKVALHVTRPGIVIGRKGVGIRELTEKLGTDFGLKNPQITVIEIDKPELSPSVMCNRMASHIERGTAFRRATMWTLQQVMENNAMGVQITISGKLRGDRSAFEKHTAGILPRAGHHAEVIVDEDIAHVKTPMGLIGIRIRIARKEKFVPEFELKVQKPKDVPKAAAQTDVKEMTDPSLGKEMDSTADKNSAPDKKEDSAPDKTTDSTAGGGGSEPDKTADSTAGGGGSEPDNTADSAPDNGQPKISTESEQIAVEAEKMKDMETLEEEENKLK